MKRKIITLLLIAIIIVVVGIVTFKKFNKDNTNLTKVRIAEVTHSVFYAPLYVAVENGYFQDEGIDIELVLTSGADKVSAAVLSNDVEIGFAGAEAAIYIYTGGEKDYFQIFSGLTKRDGQFIVSRNKDFNLTDLYGKEVLVGRKGGMPALNFLNALKNSNIDISKINLNYSIDFASLSGTFIGGIGDYVNLFEPNATIMEKEGYGYTVESIGLLSGEVPYTCFFTRKSYINNNKDIINGFTKAIDKALKFIQDNNEEVIAKTIEPQFLDNSLNDLKSIVKRYKDADSWLANPFITEESFKNLENIMIENNLLDEYVPYKRIVNNFYNE